MILLIKFSLLVIRSGQVVKADSTKICAEDAQALATSSTVTANPSVPKSDPPSVLGKRIEKKPLSEKILNISSGYSLSWSIS
jgi:hypothetical protein